jgi:hypothetical protein
LEEAAVVGRVGLAMCGKNLTKCKETGEKSTDHWSQQIEVYEVEEVVYLF